MHELTKKGLKKWSIGAGCTLTLALLFTEIKMNEPVALINGQALETGGSPSSLQSSTQDQVMNEFDNYNQKIQNSQSSITQDKGNSNETTLSASLQNPNSNNTSAKPAETSNIVPSSKVETHVNSATKTKPAQTTPSTGAEKQPETKSVASANTQTNKQEVSSTQPTKQETPVQSNSSPKGNDSGIASSASTNAISSKTTASTSQAEQPNSPTSPSIQAPNTNSVSTSQVKPRVRTRRS